MGRFLRPTSGNDTATASRVRKILDTTVKNAMLHALYSVPPVQPNHRLLTMRNPANGQRPRLGRNRREMIFQRVVVIVWGGSSSAQRRKKTSRRVPIWW